jgi:hypothetical protein
MIDFIAGNGFDSWRCRIHRGVPVWSWSAGA